MIENLPVLRSDLKRLQLAYKWMERMEQPDGRSTIHGISKIYAGK